VSQTSSPALLPLLFSHAYRDYAAHYDNEWVCYHVYGDWIDIRISHFRGTVINVTE
jgi:hypothetical protein